MRRWQHRKDSDALCLHKYHNCRECPIYLYFQLDSEPASRRGTLHNQLLLISSSRRKNRLRLLHNPKDLLYIWHYLEIQCRSVELRCWLIPCFLQLHSVAKRWNTCRLLLYRYSRTRSSCLQLEVNWVSMRLRNLRFYELSNKLPGSRVVYICFLGFLVQEHNSNAGGKRHGATSS
jgi:hypothetical protein